jgi:hypothetical protein
VQFYQLLFHRQHNTLLTRKLCFIVEAEYVGAKRWGIAILGLRHRFGSLMAVMGPQKKSGEL